MLGLAAGVTGALWLPPAKTARTDASHFMMVRQKVFFSDVLQKRCSVKGQKEVRQSLEVNGEMYDQCFNSPSIPVAKARVGLICWCLTYPILSHWSHGKRARCYSACKHTNTLIQQACTVHAHTPIPRPTTLATHNLSPITPLSPSVTFPVSPCSPATLL